MTVWGVVVCLLQFLTVHSVKSRTVLEDDKYWTRSGLADLQKQLKLERIEGRAKNIIIFIGDGMGMPTHTMSRIYKGQKKGETGEEQELAWETFPYTGLIKTYNTDYQVADSAGTATAILSGVKTKMAVLGVNTNVRYNVCDTENLEYSRVDSIMDYAFNSGKDVGVVTTARITHATPGAMYAHTANRNWEADTSLPTGSSGCLDIATQLVNALDSGKLKVAMGGGLQNFHMEDRQGKRKDKDLVEEMKSKGIKVLMNAGELDNWDADSEKTVGLFSESHMAWELTRDTTSTGQPSLEQMTRKAIARLSRNPAGYILLVEGGNIDIAHHFNLAKNAMEETLALESAVKAATEIVDITETLLIVTADHSHSVTINGYPERGKNILGTVFDPVRQNYMTDSKNRTQPYQTISYANGPGYSYHWDLETNFWKNLSGVVTTGNDYVFPAMFHLDYETHGGEDVPLYARGPQAHLLSGVHEQSYIGVLMGYAGCLADKYGCPPTTPSTRSTSSTSSTTRLLGPPLSFLLISYYLVKG